MFAKKYRNHEMNMCEGALLKKIIIYSLPLMATNILQLLFNLADTVVLSQFSKEGVSAVGAVGSTTALINLIIGLFVGLSVGANVLVAKCVGEKNKEKSEKIVGMSILVSLVFGAILAIIGVVGARYFLVAMNCDKELLDMATVYIRIYFFGMPIILLYNFVASILRAVGDTFRPLMYLIIAGVINIFLNLFFVLVLHYDVEGVAIATVVSQVVSAILSIIALLKNKGYSHLNVKKIRIYKGEFIEMLKIGVPAGLQGCVFSISNVLIQSSINKFGKVVISANTVAGQLDGFIYNAMNAVALASLAFVSQNLGAGKLDRVKKVILESTAVVTVVGFIVAAIILLFKRQLCGFFAPGDDEVIKIAVHRLNIMCTTYFLCGIMEVLSNSLRGIGKSTLAMIISLSGSCFFRILWLQTVCLKWTTLNAIYVVYPISWVLTSLILAVMVCICFMKLKKTFTPKEVMLENDD